LQPAVADAHLDSFASAAPSPDVAGLLGDTAEHNWVVDPLSPALEEPELAPNDTALLHWGEIANGSLVVDGIAPEDVMQGARGDCYFLSALASIAQAHPEALFNAIQSNDDGTFTVTFHAKPDGHVVKVTVDDELPLDAQGRPREAHDPDPHELWPMIFEKAWAAYKGGYANIDGGQMSAAVFALTGWRPTGAVLGSWNKDSGSAPKLSTDEIYSRLTAGQARGAVMMADTFGGRDYAQEGLNGLVSGHAYSVLGAKEIDGQRYVTVRNPWGAGEVGSDGKNDGIFDLKLEDFARAFHYFDVTDAPPATAGDPAP
jgi:hypothetical protein